MAFARPERKGREGKQKEKNKRRIERKWRRIIKENEDESSSFYFLSLFLKTL